MVMPATFCATWFAVVELTYHNASCSGCVPPPGEAGLLNSWVRKYTRPVLGSTVTAPIRPFGSTVAAVPPPEQPVLDALPAGKPPVTLALLVSCVGTAFGVDRSMPNTALLALNGDTQ